MPTPEKQEHTQRPRHNNSFIRYSSMATQMGVTIFLGVWGGMKLDQTFPHRIPIFTLILSLASVIIAIYMVIKDFLKTK